MAKQKLSHDQKRKAKLAKRAKADEWAVALPYDGKKYQGSRWALHVAAVELAVVDIYRASGFRLTNDHIWQAFSQLIRSVAAGESPLAIEISPGNGHKPGNEVESLLCEIRQNLTTAFETYGPIADRDVIGILRTLLHSIKAHAWNTGPERGYVVFIHDHLKQRL